MDLKEKRNATREKLVTSMAKKLAIGNGTELIAAARRKKKFRKTLYVAAGVGFFLLMGLIIYLHIPEQVKVTPEMLQAMHVKRNPVYHLFTDFSEKKITPDQYAIYLKDLLIRYDSLPENYKVEMASIRASEVYDSLVTVWPMVNLRARSNILKVLPDLEKRIQKKQYNAP